MMYRIVYYFNLVWCLNCTVDNWLRNTMCWFDAVLGLRCLLYIVTGATTPQRHPQHVAKRRQDGSIVMHVDCHLALSVCWASLTWRLYRAANIRVWGVLYARKHATVGIPMDEWQRASFWRLVHNAQRAFLASDSDLGALHIYQRRRINSLVNINVFKHVTSYVLTIYTLL